MGLYMFQVVVLWSVLHKKKTRILYVCVVCACVLTTHGLSYYEWFNQRERHCIPHGRPGNTIYILYNRECQSPIRIYRLREKSLYTLLTDPPTKCRRAACLLVYTSMFNDMTTFSLNDDTFWVGCWQTDIYINTDCNQQYDYFISYLLCTLCLLHFPLGYIYSRCLGLKIPMN